MPNKLQATIWIVASKLRISSPRGALVAALLSVVFVSTATPLRAQSSNAAGNPANNPTQQVASTETATQDQSNAMVPAEANAAADDSLPPREDEPPLEQTSTTQTYQPSESISEDSSVSFPVDI
jgi:hypothetical protein